MNRIACYANCLDASALVKLHVNEDGAETVRAYLEKQATKYTTPFCFYEALSVLKVKWLYRKPAITQEQYLKACFDLCAWYDASSKQVKDINFTSPLAFAEVQRLVKETSLDLSDASVSSQASFPILSVALRRSLLQEIKTSPQQREFKDFAFGTLWMRLRHDKP